MKKTTGHIKELQMDLICYEHCGLNVVFGITGGGLLKLLHFSSAPFVWQNLCRNPISQEQSEEERLRFIDEAFQPVQVSFSGYNRPWEKHGNKHIVTAPGWMLKYDSMEEDGNVLLIRQQDEESGAAVEMRWQFMDGLPMIRMQNTVTNSGSEPQTLEYISSFAYTGIEKEQAGDRFISSDDKMSLVIPHHGWQKELTLKQYRFPELGLPQTQRHVHQRTSKVIQITNTGNWSTKNYLPLGFIGNSAADTDLFFQIEHNGSWHWEVSDQNRTFYVCVSGPTEVQSHWFKTLQPGDSFTTVPVAAGVCRNSFEEAAGLLTRYRRMIRRPNRDNENLPIIFNDYMNCLFGDPTTEKELPMVDAAAKAGCEYYVIDAGWYSAGPWWDSVGEWRESRERFPNGLRQLTDYIRSKGMIPGVWLELQVMGIYCKLSSTLPEECFFLRHGKRVFDRSRNQLDFRHPKVIEHVNEVIDRVVQEYGIGYIKMDYNVEPGIGTEVNAENPGQGLLEHEQAYLRWLDSVFERYPDLVIENCSSGGLRMDYALLSRHSIQSTSDQEDYIHYATISANAPAGVTPEQAAVWSYPQQNGDMEETIYNTVNVLLNRIHQSGHIAALSEERFAIVKEGLDTYKAIRGDIKNGLPFWPLGFADSEDPWVASGLNCGNVIYLAVWRRGGETTFTVPLDRAFPGQQLSVECLYPARMGDVFTYCEDTRTLQLTYPRQYMARLFRITPKA